MNNIVKAETAPTMSQATTSASVLIALIVVLAGLGMTAALQVGSIASTVLAVVIALTARLIPGLHVLCGARTPEQVLDNAGALRITLDGADAVRMKWDVDAIS